MHMKNRLTVMTKTYTPRGQRQDIYTPFISDEKHLSAHKNIVCGLHNKSHMVMLRKGQQSRIEYRRLQMDSDYALKCLWLCRKDTCGAPLRSVPHIFPEK